ncbi:MAG: 4-hydroxy-3-methylbut-2-enyl diphosphate reductase, partial [Tidjanibacter sp.]|nr:4-hydroxy-3-methylbut-2-enyl diphosphate reductase [Tidjanibacter sp.]
VSGREGHLREFAASHDAVVFVCGKKSSNGKVLFEVCRSANPNSYKVEDASELDMAWLAGCKSVGVCGATSTPLRLMEEVATAIRNNG